VALDRRMDFRSARLLDLFMKTMIPLRFIGIASNVAFMSYALPVSNTASSGSSTRSSSCTQIYCH
jgi:hypothetical protein